MDLHLIGLIYTVPILIFRFLVIRRPIEKKKSLHIVIVHGIIVFLVIFLLENAPDSGMSGTNGAVIPWSFVNYWILTFGLKKKEETWKASAQICGQCGAHLPQNVRICDQCGARLQQDRRRFR